VPIEDVIDNLPAEDRPPDSSASEIDGLLLHLKAQQREIVKSISLDGNSIRDTADRLQMTEGAVRVALHRALKALGAIYRSSARED
jgi:DNA-directed RNA polymerase specialized sigma24 family protein